ncbi:MAG TPA: hypothetical protein VN739_10310 [Nitrososphaerales archaeon]|nr:hypothetical protein [Nitrososphaerales archaeon]
MVRGSFVTDKLPIIERRIDKPKEENELSGAFYEDTISDPKCPICGNKLLGSGKGTALIESIAEGDFAKNPDQEFRKKENLTENDLVFTTVFRCPKCDYQWTVRSVKKGR